MKKIDDKKIKGISIELDRSTKLNELDDTINEFKEKKHDLYSFYQVYKSIAFSDFQQRLPDLEILKNTTSNELMTLNIPLALIYSEYDVFNDNAKNNNLVFKKSRKKWYRNKTYNKW